MELVFDYEKSLIQDFVSSIIGILLGCASCEMLLAGHVNNRAVRGLRDLRQCRFEYFLAQTVKPAETHNKGAPFVGIDSVFGPFHEQVRVNMSPNDPLPQMRTRWDLYRGASQKAAPSPALPPIDPGTRRCEPASPIVTAPW